MFFIGTHEQAWGFDHDEREFHNRIVLCSERDLPLETWDFCHQLATSKLP